MSMVSCTDVLGVCVLQGNCAEFEKTVVAQCDALMEVIRRRKEELLANVHEERELKITTLKEQVSDCTALLHRTTGLLQFCIEVLKETDHSSFLQVSWRCRRRRCW